MRNDELTPFGFNADGISKLEDHSGLKLFRERALRARSEAMNKTTDPDWIEWKDIGGGQKVPYAKQAYMFSEFNKQYPLHKFKVIKVEFIPSLLSVQVVLELTDLETMQTEVGVGSARVQLKKQAREDCEAGKRQMTPFDVVNYDINVKAARTQAKKDAIKEFDICADLYKRVVIPTEVKEAWKREFYQICDEHIADPVTNAKYKKAYDSRPNKGQMLVDLRAEFDIVYDVEEEEEIQQTK